MSDLAGNMDMLVYFLGYICEFILFFYYAQTSFMPEKRWIVRFLSVFCGYMFLGYAGLQNRMELSLVLFFLVHYALLIFNYRIQKKKAVFYSLFLDALTTAFGYVVQYPFGIRAHSFMDYSSPGEFLDDFFIGKHYYGLSFADMDMRQVIFLSLGGVFVFLVGIFFLKRFTEYDDIKETGRRDWQLSFLAAVPLLTMFCLAQLMSVEMDSSVFLFTGFVLLAVNFVTFYISETLSGQNRKLRELEQESDRNKEKLAGYLVLSGKDENTKILQHDFYKHLDLLEELIDPQNTQAREYLQKIRFSRQELEDTQYTDNKIFNTLLKQKVKKCHDNGIEIHIHSDFPTLAFVSELDTVAVFSNLLDNAVEAAALSEQKEIYVDLYTVNNAYSAVKIENSAGKDPIIVDGRLLTQKPDSHNHGVGMKSVSRTLEKYGSTLNWSYDRQNKFFRSIVLLHIPKS